MTYSNELPAGLAEQASSLAAHEPNAARLTEAQRALEGLIQERSKRARSVSFGKWLAPAALGIAAVLAILVVPMLGQGVAFADVQRHFSNFRTLTFVMNTQVAGETVPQTRVYMNAEGDVRTDVGEDISVIASPAKKQGLMLIHPARAALPLSLQGQDERIDDSLGWLEDVRSYQKQAKSLGSKVVDGKTLHGWELDIKGMQTQLWADENGLPVSMQMSQDTMQMELQFAFDAPVDASLFSLQIPAGYTQQAEDES